MKVLLSLVLALSMLMMVPVAPAEVVGCVGQLIAANPDSGTWNTEEAISILKQEFDRGKAIAINLSFEQQAENTQFWYDLLSIKNILFSNFDYLVSDKSSKAMSAALKAQIKAVASAEKSFFAVVDKNNTKKLAATRDDWLDLVEMMIQSYQIATTRLKISIPDKKEYVLSPRWDAY